MNNQTQSNNQTRQICNLKRPEFLFDKPLDYIAPEELETPVEAQPKPEAIQSPQSSTEVISRNFCWTIDGVEYRNGIYQVDLAKQLLDNGSTKTQDEWAEYSIDAKAKNQFYVADMPLYHALFTALSKSNTSDSQEARDFIKEQMNASWLMTLTRIQHTPVGNKDKVVHNYGIPGEQYELDSDFVGADGFITEIKTKPTNYLEQLLGTKQSVNEIDRVYQSINSTHAYIWRINSKRDLTIERAAKFDADSEWVRFNCFKSPMALFASLGVFACTRGPAIKPERKF